MKFLVLLSVLAILGCSKDPYEACVARKQDAWRDSNPKADYAKSSTANERFRKECESYKKK